MAPRRGVKILHVHILMVSLIEKHVAFESQPFSKYWRTNYLSFPAFRSIPVNTVNFFFFI